ILNARATPVWSLSSWATVNDDEKPASMWRKYPVARNGSWPAANSKRYACAVSSENGTLFCEKLSPPSVDTNCGDDSLELWLYSAVIEDEPPIRAVTSPPES